MYSVQFAKSFLKDFRKISHEVQRVVIDTWIPPLQRDPNLGEPFVGKRLKGYLKLKFRSKKNDYRIVYEVSKQQLIILLLAIGSRENFYKRLKRRL